MQRTFFRGANLLDGTHAAASDVTIVVEGDRITHVARPDGPPPPQPDAEDQVFEVAGKTVMPGMYF